MDVWKGQRIKEVEEMKVEDVINCINECANSCDYCSQKENECDDDCIWNMKEYLEADVKDGE